MARINIEDCWWTDPRRSALTRMLGDEDLADAGAIRVWRLGQDFWKHGRALVPKQLFNTLRYASQLVQAGLAEEREEGFYVRGSSAYLDWVIDARAKAVKGGKRSATRPRDAKGRLKRVQAESKQTPSKVQVTSKLIQVSDSVSVSGSNTNTEESIGAAFADAPPTGLIETSLPAINAKAVAKQETAQKANQFVGAYVKAYQTRFPGRRPEDLNDGRVRGQLIAWLKEYPLERACQLIQVYFQMEAKWFDTKGYDFLTFRNNLSKIGQALDSGVDPGGVDWNKVFGSTG